MNRIDYLRGLEHRERLGQMVEMARSNMTASGFLAFSRGIDHRMRLLEAELAEYERSESARFCRWMGMKTYTVSSDSLPRSIDPRIADLEPPLTDAEVHGELALCTA